ncbi:Nucleotide-sugar transporter [Fragilaria crotonensis]|nr:Nucleotide-sugar transporter [Fragilaria crotonensis]
MAEPQKKTAEAAMSGFKLLLLVLMVAQNASTVLVGRYTRSSAPKEDLFIVNRLVLVTEVGKLLLSCILEFSATKGGLLTSFKDNIIDRPLDALKISVPALLYLIQNTLLYVALSNLSAPLFQVTYQGKLVTTAVVSVIMLNRKYSPKQWVCLVVLSIGVALAVLGESKDTDTANRPAQSLAVGLIAVTVACFCSALAGVYFEFVLKNTTKDSATGAARAPVSMWMRNVQLAFFSIVISLCQSAAYPESAEDAAMPYLHGFTAWAWLLVTLQAAGGLLVAAVIKYADNVLKGLATGVSVVVATGFSAVFFSTALSGQFSVGAVMILVSVYFFSNDAPQCMKPSGKPSSSEMASMLPR